MRFTLDDEAIFGPRLDYECACGKYRGRQFERMICDRCGVKVTSSESRRSRFGHIDLLEEVRLPFEEMGCQVDAVPVLPAAFRESIGGRALAELYEQILQSTSPFDHAALSAALERIAAVVLPKLVAAHEWGFQESVVFANGLALVARDDTADDRCCNCGFPLSGLRLSTCPGCGKGLGTSG